MKKSKVEDSVRDAFLERIKRPGCPSVGTIAEEMHLPKLTFLFYLLGSAFLAFGFVDFPLFTAHVASLNIMESQYLPLIYSYAMLIDAIAAMVFGLLYDKKGFVILVVATLLSSSFGFFFFLFDTYWSIIVGATLWGIGMGAQESIMLSAITDLTSKNKRGKAFGTFDVVFGVAWFLGSLLYGFLYEVSFLALAIVSFSSIIISSVMLFISYRYKLVDR